MKKGLGQTGSGLLVKICGLTQVDNALDCARAGADLIGLVFFPKSPRHVTIERAKAISSALPVPTCGVFVDADTNTILETARSCELSAVQLHGHEPPDMVATLKKSGLLVIKAFFAARSPGLDRVSDYPDIDFYLAEYGKGSLPGGNAETWDYGLASGAATLKPLMLAGGLTPGNVAQAVGRSGARAVDASSSLESAPGFKDITRVTAFIRNARAAVLPRQ